MYNSYVKKIKTKPEREICLFILNLMETNKLKHLEFIQGIINRMAHNSFIIKGWLLTIITALIAISINKDTNDLITVTFIPIIIFWFLDAFFLRQERLFRHLYNKVRKQKENKIDFSMRTDGNLECYLSVFFSLTLSWYYFGIILIITSIYFLI